MGYSYLGANVPQCKSNKSSQTFVCVELLPTPLPSIQAVFVSNTPGEEPQDSLPTACFVLKPILSKEGGFVVAVVFKSLKGCRVLVNVEDQGSSPSNWFVSIHHLLTRSTKPFPSPICVCFKWMTKIDFVSDTNRPPLDTCIQGQL